MDVFGQAMRASGFLCDAAIAAGHELGVFDALGRRTMALGELAAALDVVAGQRRLGALLDVLAAIGACVRLVNGRFAAAAVVPPRPVVPAAGWGLIAEVIRRNKPLATEDVNADTTDGETLRRLHHHLASAGAAAAEELVPLLGSTSLLDLGAGAGAYSQAFLRFNLAGQATLVDRADVLALAARWLGPVAQRARRVAGDASTVEVGSDHGAALLANLLHLHSPDMCARLCQVAARAVAPGGIVAIKELRVDDDRAGPLDGLLFALNMAIYTDAGNVYSTSQLRTWLAEAGLVDIAEHGLAAAPDAVVMLGHRPRKAVATRRVEQEPSFDDSAESPVFGRSFDEANAAIAAELDAALARTAAAAWQELRAARALRPEAEQAGPPTLALPRGLRSFLAAALAVERSDASRGDTTAAERVEQLVRHYTDAMPRMRLAQLAGTSEPGQTLFHIQLDWQRLPRLSAAIDRLFTLAAEASVDTTGAFGAASAEAFRAHTPTLAALYERTHYGGFMPLLYGYPADLAYFHARGLAEQRDPLATIDHYLTAPIVHELCHGPRDRRVVLPPHLDECAAGWLGVYVHPELAYPTCANDDALYAAPWLAQVGQAIARAFGVASVVRMQLTGDASTLPAPFVRAAARLGWADWRTRRTLHFLSDTFDPAPWLALVLGDAGATGDGSGDQGGASGVDGNPDQTLADDPAFDRAIVEHGLRAMCLVSAQIDGSFRTRAELPDGAIIIDPAARAIIAPGRRALDPVVPRYWLPLAIAARLATHQPAGYSLTLHSLAAIPAVAAALCDPRAVIAFHGGGFSLTTR